MAGLVALLTSKRMVKSDGLLAALQVAGSVTAPIPVVPVPVLAAAAAVAKSPLPVRIRWKISEPASLIGT